MEEFNIIEAQHNISVEIEKIVRECDERLEEAHSLLLDAEEEDIIFLQTQISRLQITRSLVLTAAAKLAGLEDGILKEEKISSW